METDTIPLPSGRKLRLAVAPFSTANKLRKVVASELLAVRIDVDLAKIDFELDVSKMDSRALNTMKDVVCKLLASDAVEACFWECAARCTLDGVKITRGDDRNPGTFDDVESRPDMLPVAWEVIRANLAPFFAGLGSLFSTAIKPKTKSQPSE